MRRPPSRPRTVRLPDGAWQRVGPGVAHWPVRQGLGLLAVALAAWGVVQVGAPVVARAGGGVALAVLFGYAAVVLVAGVAVLYATRTQAELFVSTRGALLLGPDGGVVARAAWPDLAVVRGDGEATLALDGTPRRVHFDFDDSADWQELERAARIHGGDRGS